MLPEMRSCSVVAAMPYSLAIFLKDFDSCDLLLYLLLLANRLLYIKFYFCSSMLIILSKHQYIQNEILFIIAK